MRSSGILDSLRRALGMPRPTAASGAGPVALVYRGRSQEDRDCADTVVDLLAQGPWGLEVRTVGPRGDLPLSSGTLASAQLYAQPGGGSLAPAYQQLKQHKEAIRDFVRQGGHYLGFCLGGYLAGEEDGFGLLSGTVDQYIITKGATVITEEDALIELDWRGRRRTLFFQDGAYFAPAPHPDTTVLATYTNGLTAALVTSYGAGRVAVVGPHPEATDDWFTDATLPFQDTHDLALDFVTTALNG
ncbi:MULTISPECIES: BPL-N domain-containing protein [unclassified Streptomyces]|uniref:BPL-N domain-containing protein n=1 Tax=unclassified Streptomyces TaxID=2593676 RepID=UPI002E2B5C4D|nr:BPL-N domain-containing protein [Streptomyces sp. NBC_01429]